MRIEVAMQEFLAEKSIENASKNTIDTYKYLFENLLEWCKDQGIENIEDITPRVLRQYFAYLKEVRKNNSVSVNTKHKLLTTFFNFLVDEEIVDHNPVKAIKRARVEKRMKVYTDEQVKQIMAYLRRRRRRETTFYAFRDYTAFVILIGTGMRVGELVNLKWEDVDFKNRTLKLFGKARAEQIMPLSDKLVSELAFWQNYCTDVFGKLPEYVITDRQGRKATENSIKCFFKRLSDIMGFRCCAHSCRHYFAKKWIQSGGDLYTLSKMLRHKNIRTTTLYLQFFTDELREKNEKFNPLAELI